jgi:SAM-dependent methyltransferase
LNRELFRLHDIDPENVIHADFFDDKFHEEFNEHFDIVVSRGFIEHFTELDDVIEKHLNLLAEGGYLVISIPNLSMRSFYGKFSSIFTKERFELHNLNIMSLKPFTELFERKELLGLFCDYYGTINLRLLSANKKFLVRVLVSICWKLQPLLNPILRLVFRSRGLESKFFSPFLLYIGKKNAG